MAGELARILMKIFDPKQAQFNELTQQLPPDAAPHTLQNVRRSVYGQPEDIELPAEPRLGQSLRKAAEGLRALRDKGLVKRR